MKINLEKSEHNPKPNALKREHLKEEFSPILVSVGEIKQHFSDYESLFPLYRLLKYATDIKYGETTKSLDEKGFKHDGENTYIISTIDGRDKKSEGFKTCTGCIVVGVDKNTGKNISFLSHQDPFHFTEEGKSAFMKDFSESLSEIKNRSVEGSVDAIVVGGNALGLSYKGKNYEDYYKDSIEIISTLIEKELGFLPVVTTEAKKYPGSDTILFDTEHRRAYLLRNTKMEDDDNTPYLFKKGQKE